MSGSIYWKIKKNAKCIAKVVGISLATIGATAVEIAGSVDIMNKIVDGCDEDNPANFAQTAGVMAVAIGAGIVETGTVYGGMYLVANEIEENWK